MATGEVQPGSDGTAELASQLEDLAASVRRLDVRIEKQFNELDARSRNLLEAVALIYDDDQGTRRRLHALRAGPGYEPAFDDPDPLVSVVVPTWNRVNTLIERAIPSALNQTHTNIEVVVVGDASPPAVADAVAALGDSRVRFHNLTIRGPYDEDPFRAWLTGGTPGINAGMALARGLWITVLGDDDALVPKHVERLLSHAREGRLKFVYGRIRQNMPDGNLSILGGFPPRPGQIGLQAALFHAGLRLFEVELGHALFGTPVDWGMVHRMMRTGVRMGMIDAVTADYWPSMRGQVTPSARQSWGWTVLRRIFRYPLRIYSRFGSMPFANASRSRPETL